jgi:hypothetical protein
MPLYFFLSEVDAAVRAFSSDETGSNLPASYAPWRRSSTAAVLSVDDGIVAQTVRREGHFLMSGDVARDQRDSEHR